MWHVGATAEVSTGFFVGRPEGKIPVGRPRRRCEDNIKMGFCSG